MSSADVHRLPAAIFGRASRIDPVRFDSPDALASVAFAKPRRVGEARLPESTGPVLIPPAPSFPGMNFAQFIPANLYLGGDLALNDPIGNLPLYGDLIPGGAFTASGSARPIVADDGTGRVGMSMDGVDDMPAIAGLSLDLTAGCTLYVVLNQVYDISGAGWLRADAGSTASNQSVIEGYYSTAVAQYFATSNRLTSPSTTQVAYPPAGLKSICQIHSDGSEKGIYGDGVLLLAGAVASPDSIIQNIQIAGFDRRKFKGFAYTWILYNAEHTPAQRLVVRDYMRNNFNGGSAF